MNQGSRIVLLSIQLYDTITLKGKMVQFFSLGRYPAQKTSDGTGFRADNFLRGLLSGERPLFKIMSLIPRSDESCE